jgi:hypothetical protein
MIAAQQVVPVLLEACPSFRGPYEAYVAATYRPDEPHLIYDELGEFARHLLRLLKDSNTAELPAVFAVVEHLHVDGTDEVRELATIGLLDAIQNIAAHEIDPERFVTFLGPEARRWWDELNAFWRGERSYVGAGLRVR